MYMLIKVHYSLGTGEQRMHYCIYFKEDIQSYKIQEP